ncbi:hypothetical protein [Agrobacterium larrymoorei]|uniref:Glycoside hydrolase family 19 catalytic domain-containing protein n=1 Tax=Agrobacterium larrymoorei TaxID=160699 RepID=A0AAF0H7E8_9HYPH|nr:hypothetical protein [Agrobacterium larrymoorei]WHA40427.1 hypothetical protein CFBP5477_011380 [Agrobacterium larrymoorei]
MTLNRQRFFSAVRANPFGGKLTLGQVKGTEIILDLYYGRGEQGDARHLAYMLATAVHETAATMQPVRETLAASDEAAIRILDAAFAAGRLPQVRTPYWRRDADGKSWLGRGLVQLTHRRNYEAMSVLTGIDLVAAPHLAMEPKTSAVILIEGMRNGSFTGRRLSHYLNAQRTDWEGARAIINGTDRAALIASHAKAFYAALLASQIEPATAG